MDKSREGNSEIMPEHLKMAMTSDENTLIIEDNTIYEIDLNCLQNKKKQRSSNRFGFFSSRR